MWILRIFLLLFKSRFLVNGSPQKIIFLDKALEPWTDTVALRKLFLTIVERTVTFMFVWAEIINHPPLLRSKYSAYAITHTCHILSDVRVCGLFAVLFVVRELCFRKVATCIHCFRNCGTRGLEQLQAGPPRGGGGWFAPGPRYSGVPRPRLYT